MKKRLLVVATVLTLFVACLTGCNKQIFDTTYTYNYAIIYLQNGTVVEGKVESWTDYEGEQLQVKIDGVTYLTSSINCTLMNKPE